MALLILLVLATLFLAYSNGANDNFKGVATLFGSNTTNYKQAIRWATITTFLGSVGSVFLATTLLQRFSGKGLVPDAIAASPQFLIAVAIGAAATVLLAAMIGFPISTTHSLIGALVGGGVMAVGSQVNFAVLGKAFFLPLLASPLVAVSLSATAYVAFRSLRLRLGVTEEWCVCVGQTEQVFVTPQPASVFQVSALPAPVAAVDTRENCTRRYAGRVFGIEAQKVLDAAHFFSAGVVSFARGLNDTPKVVALLLAIQAFDIRFGMVAVAVAMAAGGLLNARKVAHTMSKKITPMNHGQGFTANLITGALVLFASRLGMPVSTTHVSVGSLFGLGLITRQANTRVIGEILLSWVLTLPVAALLSAAVYWLLRQ